MSGFAARRLLFDRSKKRKENARKRKRQLAVYRSVGVGKHLAKWRTKSKQISWLISCSLFTELECIVCVESQKALSRFSTPSRRVVGKAVRNYSVCMEIPWQITFSKIEFYTICESQLCSVMYGFCCQVLICYLDDLVADLVLG